MQTIKPHLIKFLVLFVFITAGFIYVYFQKIKPHKKNNIITMQHMGEHINRIGQYILLNQQKNNIKLPEYQKLHAREEGYFSSKDEKVYQLKEKNE